MPFRLQAYTRFHFFMPFMLYTQFYVYHVLDFLPHLMLVLQLMKIRPGVYWPRMVVGIFWQFLLRNEIRSAKLLSNLYRSFSLVGWLLFILWFFSHPFFLKSSCGEVVHLKCEIPTFSQVLLKYVMYFWLLKFYGLLLDCSYGVATI